MVYGKIKEMRNKGWVLFGYGLCIFAGDVIIVDYLYQFLSYRF